MTIYRLLSFWTVVRILCKKAGKRSCDTEWRIYCFWWHLTVFLTTAADPSHSLRMTPCRPLSFWAEAKMPYKKTGKRQCDTEWRIYYSDDVLPAFLTTGIDPSHGSGWHLTVYCRSVRGKNTCEKDRKRNSDTEWRIYYADGVTDSLPLVLRFVFLHIVFDRSYSVWRVFLYNRVFVIFMCIYNFSKIREE